MRDLDQGRFQLVLRYGLLDTSTVETLENAVWGDG